MSTQLQALSSRPTAPPRAAIHAGHRGRWWIVGAAIAAAAVAAILVVRGRSTSSAPYRFVLSTVDRGAIQARVTATGTVNPIVTVQVGTQVSGTIQSLGADFNTVVKPDQMIAQIDPSLFKAALGQAQANLLAAHANTHKVVAQLTDARRQAARMRALLAEQLVAQQDADTSDTNADVAAAEVEAAKAAEAQAEAALASAKIDLSHTTIVSPIRGTVITRNVDIGQTVAASFAAPTLFVIGEDLTKMQVDTSIAESDVGRLAAGMTATFTVDAFPAEVFTGRIREVRSSPQIVQNVVTYDAVVDVDNPEFKLKPGMTANLDVIYADRADALRVSNAALRFRAPRDLAGKTPPAPQGSRLVWVLRDKVPTAVTLEPGASDGTFTEILGGDLRPGDAVVVEANATKASGAGRIL